MAFDIGEFLSDITKHGVSKPSQFDVVFTRPSKFSGPPFSAEHLSFRCETAELPGRQVATTPYRIYGATHPVAYNHTNLPINLTFLCSEFLSEKVYFESWIEYIAGLTSNKPDDTPRMNAQYYDNYVADMEIHQFQMNQNTKIYSAKFIEIFPTNVLPLTLDRKLQNEVHKVQVTFAYKRWARIPHKVGGTASSGRQTPTIMETYSQGSGKVWGDQTDGTVMGTYSQGSGKVWGGQ